MSKISITNVEILDNPAKFSSKLSIKITFECLESLEQDLEWKLIYVGSAYNPKLDQVLDSVLVGPIPVGRHQFVLDTDAPDPAKIPVDDIVGVTVVLLEGFYLDQEFVRIGFFVSNDYENEQLKDNPPEVPIIEELTRHIIDADPRITRFAINWGDEELVDTVEGEEVAGTEIAEVVEAGETEDVITDVTQGAATDNKENEGVQKDGDVKEDGVDE